MGKDYKSRNAIVEALLNPEIDMKFNDFELFIRAQLVREKEKQLQRSVKHG